MCHVSCVTCHVSQFFSLFFYFFFGQCGEAYRWRVCYQRGLPRLVFYESGILTMNINVFFNEINQGVTHTNNNIPKKKKKYLIGQP